MKITMPRAMISTGMATTNTMATCPAVTMDKIMPAAAIMGANMPKRNCRERKFWMFVTSEVFRVMRDAAENLSISGKENPSTLRKMMLRSSAEKFVVRRAASLVDAIFSAVPRAAKAIMPPAKSVSISSSPFVTPLSIIIESSPGTDICAIDDSATKTAIRIKSRDLNRTRDNIANTINTSTFPFLV